MTLRAAGALLALGLAVAACGDATGAYVDETAGIVDTMRTESIAATPRGGAITIDGVTAVNEARRTAAGALDAIQPPSEIRPEHLAVVTALDDLVGAVDDFLEDATDLTPEAFAAATEGAVELQTLAGRVARACQTLDARIAALGFDADIRC